MRQLLLLGSLIFTLVAAACGGDDDTDTPTPAAGSPTTAQTSPTSAQSTPRPTGEAGGTGGTGGSTGRPQATQVTEATRVPDASPTRRPATVVSTPRPIATKAPTPTPRPEATATSSGGDALPAVLDLDFDDGNAGPFPVGTSDSGATYQVVDGAYAVTEPEGYYKLSVADPPIAITDGSLGAYVAISGDGYAGLIARDVVGGDGTDSYAFCWIATDGSAGCHEVINDTFTELFSTESGVVDLSAYNYLAVYVFGTTISFDINGETVGQAELSDQHVGNWGFYTESVGGTTTAYFDDVLLLSADGGATTPVAGETPTEAVGETVVVSEDFESGESVFWTGMSEDGSGASIQGGQYVVTAVPGYWYFYAVNPSIALTDGAIEAQLQLSGAGAVGVIAREVTNSDGTYTFDLCWINDLGEAGCHRVENGTFTQLFRSPEDTVDPTALNSVRLIVIGSQLQYEVNGQTIGTVDDDALAAGNWGVYLEAFDTGEGAAGAYDNVLILSAE